MSVLTTLGVFNYGLVLLYGLFLSTFISGGWENTKQRTLVFAACPLFLMIQSVCWLALGADMARQLYPDARIEITGFEKTNRKDFFDVAVGNVPTSAASSRAGWTWWSRRLPAPS